MHVSPAIFVVAMLLTALQSVTHAEDEAVPATGLKFADPAVYASIPSASPVFSGPLPDVVDLSPRFPAPGSQGRQGSCVAWAIAYGLKSYQENVERGWGVDTDAHRFSPSFLYNQIAPSSCNGSSYIDALNVVRSRGA